LGLEKEGTDGESQAYKGGEKVVTRNKRGLETYLAIAA
jgi:hypothetical protein